MSPKLQQVRDRVRRAVTAVNPRPPRKRPRRARRPTSRRRASRCCARSSAAAPRPRADLAGARAARGRRARQRRARSRCRCASIRRRRRWAGWRAGSSPTARATPSWPGTCCAPCRARRGRASRSPSTCARAWPSRPTRCWRSSARWWPTTRPRCGRSSGTTCSRRSSATARASSRGRSTSASTATRARTRTRGTRPTASATGCGPGSPPTRTRRPRPPPGRRTFAVMDYGHPGADRASANIGDHIQSIASLGHLVRHQGVRLHGRDDLAALLERLRERTRPERRLRRRRRRPRRHHRPPRRLDVRGDPRGHVDALLRLVHARAVRHPPRLPAAPQPAADLRLLPLQQARPAHARGDRVPASATARSAAATGTPSTCCSRSTCRPSSPAA